MPAPPNSAIAASSSALVLSSIGACNA
jgi:hypothetical protein